MMTEHSEQGSLLGKIAAYTELLHKDPSSTIFVPLSEAYRQMGMLDDAVEIAKNGIMQNPAFPSGYVAYGRSLAQQGLVEKAADEFDKALILDRNNLAALKSLAKIRIQQGRSDDARKLLDEARKVNPDDSSVGKMLTMLAKQAQSQKSSPAVTDDASSLGSEMLDRPGGPISTATIAEIYIRQGFPEKALKVYRDLLRSEPQNAQLRQRLIELKEQFSNGNGKVPEEGGDASIESSQPALVDRDESVDVSNAEPVASKVDTLVEISGSGLSLTEVFAGWLDAISRRKEAHVQ